MNIEDKILALIDKYSKEGDDLQRYSLVVLRASYSKHNKTIDPDDAIGYADWTANSEVLIVLDELLEFINKSKEGVDDE